MKQRFLFMVSLLLLWAALPASALTVDEKLPDAQQEMRAQQLFHALRCVVCQSETIADSPAAIASDMRRSIRKSIAEGQSDEAITSALIAHYGPRVLMMPEHSMHNLPLWYLPLLLLLIGMMVAWKHLFRRRS